MVIEITEVCTVVKRIIIIIDQFFKRFFLLFLIFDAKNCVPKYG